MLPRLRSPVIPETIAPRLGRNEAWRSAASMELVLSSDTSARRFRQSLISLCTVYITQTITLNICHWFFSHLNGILINTTQSARADVLQQPVLHHFRDITTHLLRSYMTALVLPEQEAVFTAACCRHADTRLSASNARQLCQEGVRYQTFFIISFAHSKWGHLMVYGWHHGWFCGTAEERWSLTSELSLSCARPTVDG